MEKLIIIATDGSELSAIRLHALQAKFPDKELVVRTFDEFNDEVKGPTQIPFVLENTELPIVSPFFFRENEGPIGAIAKRNKFGKHKY
jgi:hypothetical protein